MMGYYGFSRWCGPGIIGGGLFMMLIPLLLIGIIVYLVFRNSNHQSAYHADRFNHPLEILDERFAKGEIDEEEYQHRKQLLRKK